MNPKVQTILKPPLLALFILLLFGALSDVSTWGFTLARHTLTTPLSAPTQGSFPPSLLHQTWKLSAQGKQSYVFFSEEGTHVLKLFKDQPRPWLKWPSYQAQKNKKLLRTVSGYELIYTRCNHLSNILLIHSKPSKTPLPATLIDRLGITHSIDLSSYLFVIQKRASPLNPPSNPQEKEELLRTISLFLQTLSGSHLKDHDPRLHLNLGWLEDDLMLIDPGRIEEDPSSTPLQLPAKLLKWMHEASI